MNDQKYIKLAMFYILVNLTKCYTKTSNHLNILKWYLYLKHYQVDSRAN